MQEQRNATATAQLTQFLCDMRARVQAVDAAIKAFDKQVSELHHLGLIHRTILLGPVALTRGYAVGGPSISGEVVQAALASDGGAAAIFWDSEDRCLDLSVEETESEAMDKARRLADCPAAIRTAVWPHMNELLAKLIADIKTA